MPAPSQEQWRRISPHLDQLLDLPPQDQAAYLARVRDGDGELASELTAALAAHEAAVAEGFLDRAGSQPMRGIIAGQSIGAYTLVAEIGHGGMASVWLAERRDGRFQRRVAVKFLALGLASREGEERFRREGAMLARLAHPHIAQLVDAGVTQAGQPYLVIEHVDGVPIDRYCDGHRHSLQARVGLFIDVLAAVAAAHAQLVVHRDLKPANVLVDSSGRVKLLDFGIAKLINQRGEPVVESAMTRVGGWALTPEYAAPEQVTGAAISTATDIYSLGVMLYELLSGRHPVGRRLDAPMEVVKAVVETSPAPMSDAFRSGQDPALPEGIADARATSPERLRLGLAGDLDTIVAKALKKDPAERYVSADAFAEDLRRFLRHEPISARADSALYRAGKFLRRHRIAATFSFTALTAIAAGTVGTVYQARLARDERDYALRQLSRAETINDFNHFLLSDAAPLGRPLEVSELLGRAEQIARRQSAGSVESRTDLLIAVGEQFRAMDEPDRARNVLQRASELAATSSDPSVRARSDCALAHALAKGDGLERAKSLVAGALANLPDEPRTTQARIYCLKAASFVAREDGASEAAIARI